MKTQKSMQAILRYFLGAAPMLLLSPEAASAQGPGVGFLPGISASPTVFIVGLIILAVVLARSLVGILNLFFLEQESLASIERRHPYMPFVRTVIGTAFVTMLLILLSFRTISGIAPFDGPNGWIHASITLAAFGIAAVVSQVFWPSESRQYIFGGVMGTIITFALIGFERAILSTQLSQDPFAVTFGLVCLIIAWRFLFGPWHPRVKAFVLGTFIFWVSVHIIFRESHTERLAHMLAAMIALIPAIIWCLLFLGYHRQRLSMVFLMFFSGMISTAPILLYDKILRSGLELQFFLFRIVPQSFTQSSNSFVAGRLGATASGYQSTILATLVSFLLVGLIEEMSKFWVLKESGSRSFRSIDDVIQLGIIVAIGFAFAENVLNPNYFLQFVKDHLVGQTDWAGFLGNFFGRSILTTMVHIVSTGVLGYYLGLSIFTESILRDEAVAGTPVFMPRFLHYFFRLPEEEVFRREMLIFGATIAVLLHGLFNFLVTLPSLLPGNPRTIGDLVGASESSLLHYIAILVIPALFYVVGGFWLLSAMFASEQNTKKRAVGRSWKGGVRVEAVA